MLQTQSDFSKKFELSDKKLMKVIQTSLDHSTAVLERGNTTFRAITKAGEDLKRMGLMSPFFYVMPSEKMNIFSKFQLIINDDQNRLTNLDK